MTKQLKDTYDKKERAVLVGIDLFSDKDGWSIESSLDELSNLTKTAGAEVVHRIIQKKDNPSNAFYIGKGKLEELVNLQSSINYNVVIFNDELKPNQQKNLEDALNVKVIDRTALIIDIFAKSARTREGALQVELAQYQYLLPRLAGQWSHLERLGGGIGTRGPGESQIETDRRLIRNKISQIKLDIEAVRTHRDLYRKKRKSQRIPLVALVGYTNAGKSTLINAICKSDVVAENKLFSTLDPVTRRLRLPDGKNVLITDTVGFIHKLPPLIVTAFRATLEEIKEADLLINVVDITNIDAVNQSITVEKILKEMGLESRPRLTVINKIDQLVNSVDDVAHLELKVNAPPESIIIISAKKNWNLDKLIGKISEFINFSDCEDDKSSDSEQEI